jgi:uncharacterized membrane protein
VNKGRFEAFSDGVIAILITIMVLELTIPHGAEWMDLMGLAPVFLSYVLSFIYIGIYWNNHHHLFQIVKQVDGRVLWANLFLLFWLSLVPFVTGWMGENNFAALPVALYGVVLLCAALAYYILVRALLAVRGQSPALAEAIGRDFKGLVSLILYAIAIPLAFVFVWLAFALYVLVAVIWLIPDRRIENKLSESSMEDSWFNRLRYLCAGGFFSTLADLTIMS